MARFQRNFGLQKLFQYLKKIDGLLQIIAHFLFAMSKKDF